jgi:subtilisin family serine protease
MDRILCILSVGAVAFGGAIAPLIVSENPSNSVPNRYIITMNHASSTSRVAALLAKRQMKSVAVEQTVHLPIINALSMTLDAEALAMIRNDSDVQFVEQVQRFHTLGGSWGIDRINQRNLPLDGNSKMGTDGSGVDVYVVDTGVDIEHPQFEGRASFGYSAIPGETGDGAGHGTHCAGTIASRDYGVAVKANIISVKVLSNAGSGTNEGIIQGISYIMNFRSRNRPAVASMSLGGGYSRALNYAINYLVASGVTTIVAAGNENQDACRVSPASAISAITVGSTTFQDSKSSFSNYGRCVDILAPGSDITSTWPNGQINTISGTSMATPHVAGAAALYLSIYKNAIPSQVEAALLNDAGKGLISGFSGTVNSFLYALYRTSPTTTSTVIPSTTEAAPTGDARLCKKTCSWIPDGLCDVKEVCDNFPSICSKI